MLTIYRTNVDKISIDPISNQCIIIDLDQTLISTQENVNSLLQLNIFFDPKFIKLRHRVYHLVLEDFEAPGLGTKFDFWGITRPFAKEFLEYCFSRFVFVGIWSAGKREYVEAIVDFLCRDLIEPHTIFSRDQCLQLPGNIIEKPIQTHMIDINPIIAQYVSLRNTFILDDNSRTFINNKDNGIHIPAYSPEYDPNLSIEDNIEIFKVEDNCLLELIEWLSSSEIITCDDIRILDKTHIFSIHPSI